MDKSLRDYRENYSAGELLESEVAACPFEQFKQWLATAQNCEFIIEPTAMTIATASADGRPSARMVLLKELDESGDDTSSNHASGFVFYTNYDSRKGRELGENPYATLLFHWPPLERQIRIEGKVEKVSSAQSSDYFNCRPKASQLGAAASPQSQAISRENLDRHFAELEAEFADKPVPRPEQWGGYRLIPDYFEFWQGRRSRLHDRISYIQSEQGWQLQRLAP